MDEFTLWLERSGLNQQYQALVKYFQAIGVPKKESYARAQLAFPIGRPALVLSLENPEDRIDRHREQLSGLSGSCHAAICPAAALDSQPTGHI